MSSSLQCEPVCVSREGSVRPALGDGIQQDEEEQDAMRGKGRGGRREERGEMGEGGSNREEEGEEDRQHQTSELQ